MRDVRRHNRRSTRLKGYDYTQAGAYFITIPCQNRKHRFGKIEAGEMILNEFGRIAYDEWQKLPERFPNLDLDVFQVMPNHMHGIIILNDNPVRATLAVAPSGDATKNDLGENDDWATARVAPTIGNIIGAYKSIVFNKCLEIYKSQNKTMGKLWQRNYWEIIIRNERSHQNISAYIINNPKKWQEDKFYKK
ncbi:hypothetical protein FHG64_05600 [Antarcticibacterium flavum]|uniref:Transposase IS200-like domain-containing protein n=1 Tax=Antarcticibacterium flavum TaxID=2058175 RepID=A0A5B7X2Q0_9FLAO|nr:MULTISPECIES: transposase [Antarcticibacterium]MCM4159920.1 hypothetical protein [Antarcticibacterium sp. W02-3]QCY68918.1 hypothetical protein FHG64_05600 [Antarcticibacterium flavum]